MKTNKRLFKLNGKVQHYQWGGTSFLPKLLDVDNPAGKPFAEYWLGAHENVPSEVEGASVKELNRYIQQNPSVLGGTVQEQFGKLPYLLKVLDVRDMLSIQVHPSKQAAVAEYEKENKAGIPLTASNRNYKDDNHKPELMLALSDFWLLHGFKAVAQIHQSIAAIPEFDFMASLFNEGDYERLYRSLMEMNQQKVNQVLQPLLDRIVPQYESGELSDKTSPDFWAARAALSFNEPGKLDRGIFSIYLLNLVHLNEGEAIFQDAGVLHAYLEGQNMEIMANSDNVLRGGLTPKHIDVAELVKHISFGAVTPFVVHGKRVSHFEEAYPSPAPDFQLSRLLISRDATTSIKAATAEIFMVLEGAVEMEEQGDNFVALARGQAAVAFAGAEIQIHAIEKSIVFRATVPSA